MHVFSFVGKNFWILNLLNVNWMCSGFFDENFPGNAADLSFKDHSFSSNHGEVVTANVFHSLSQFTKYICTGKRHARPAQFFQGHRHGVDRRHFSAPLSRITKYWHWLLMANDFRVSMVWFHSPTMVLAMATAMANIQTRTSIIQNMKVASSIAAIWKTDGLCF